MSKPMTRKEWLSYLEQTWDAAQKKAWSEQPRREWVGLTEAEKVNIALSCGCADVAWMEFADAIESKLREKNT